MSDQTNNVEICDQPQFYESLGAWQAEAAKRFGNDPFKWRFVCPVCKNEMSVQDWKDAGAPESTAAFSCVGDGRTIHPRSRMASRATMPVAD